MAKAVEAGTLVDGATTLGDFYVNGKVHARFDQTGAEYTEIGHGGSNGYINTVGDGRLDFRHDNDTKMSLTDAGDLNMTGNLSVGGSSSLSPTSMGMENEGSVQAYNNSDEACSAGSITSGG